MLIVWIVGIFFSRFLQSVATISMCFVFLLNNNWKSNFKKIITTPIVISFVGIFFIYAISIFTSENKLEYWNIVKNKIPFLFIPLSIVSIDKLNKKFIKISLFVFIASALISSIWSYIQYIQHIEIYEKLYSEGKVIPTLVHHVSFSILLCFAVLFILYIIGQSRNKIEQVILSILLVWFVYFIHILSVRTGIVLLYISILLYAFSILIIHKKLVFAGVLMLLIIANAYYAYEKIPSIKGKIGYTLYSLDMYKKNADTTNHVSDTRRILSYKIGIEILKKHKIYGVGFGNIQQEMNKIYKQEYPSITQDVYSHIHNQYLYVITSAGIILGSLFCILICIPLIEFIKHKNVVFAIAYFLLLLIMLWESYIENQLGTSIFLWLSCIGFANCNTEK